MGFGYANITTMAQTAAANALGEGAFHSSTLAIFLARLLRSQALPPLFEGILLLLTTQSQGARKTRF